MRVKSLIFAATLLASSAQAQLPMQYFQHQPAAPLTGNEQMGPVRQNGSDRTVTTGQIAGLVTSSGIGVTGSDGKVRSGLLVNRTPATPLTTTVGTTLTTIFPASSYVSVRIKLVVPGPLTCTGDGGNTSATALPGMDLHWPNDAGQMAPGPFQCSTPTPGTVTANAY